MIDQNSAVGSSLNLLQHLCKSAGSITSEVQIVNVIKDIKISEKKTKENEPTTGLNDEGKKIPDERTLKEANIVLSLDSDNQFSKGTSARVNQYAHLSLQEFKLNEAETEAKNKFSAVIFEFSVRCSVAQVSLPDDDIVLPSIRKRFGIESRQSDHQSQITYLRIINEPSDNKETILKVINFLYNVYDVETLINHLVVIGDAKTYELLRKRKDEYGGDLNWLIPLIKKLFFLFSWLHSSKQRLQKYVNKKLFLAKCKLKHLLYVQTLKLFEVYSIFCDKMAKSDDTWKFWNIFTDNVMLPYVDALVWNPLC